MIVKTKTGNILEGPPEEIATYFKAMTRTKKPSRAIKSSFNRRPYDKSELRAIVKLANKGKSAIQIARKLYKDGLSPIKRTASAITNALLRINAGTYTL